MKLLAGFWFAPIVAGSAMLASFPPLDLGWLMPAAWALLYLSMRLRAGRRAGWQCFVAAMVLFGPGVWWLTPLAWPLWLIVVLWGGLWEGLCGRVAGRLLGREGGPPAAWVVVLPALHLLADMLRTTVLSGFPWMLPGYAGWKNPVLLGSADLIGVHGASLATLTIAAGAAECVSRLLMKEGRAVRPLAPGVALWAGLAAWAFVKPAVEETPGPTLLLLQPSIPQQWKEDLVKSGQEAPTPERIWAKQEELAKKGLDEAAAAGRTVDLVVWAETMVPEQALRPLQTGKPLRAVEWLADRSWVASTKAGARVAAAGRGAETLAGFSSVEVVKPRELVFNTMILLDAEGRVRGFQDKQHLTPGGEYIPLRGLIPFRDSFEDWLREHVGFLPDLQAGDAPHVLTLRGGGRVGVLICYEFLFPQVALDEVRDGATLLVNAANFGWFTGTKFMPQALAVCAFRSAELRRPLVLASNNGISAVLGPDGRVRGPVTRADEPTSFLASVPLCASRSPFSVAGEWPAWALGAAGLAACLLLRKRPSSGS